MSGITFDAPYDWGKIYVGESKVFTISYSNTGGGTVSDLNVTVTSDVENVSITDLSATIVPTSGWISPDTFKFQNSMYPQYSGDTSNQVEVLNESEIFDNYQDSLLYCFSMKVGSPTEKSGTVVATATYTYTVPGDPLGVPPTTDVITQETTSQVYEFTEVKNLDSLGITLTTLVDMGTTNQEIYESNNFEPL